MTLNAYLNRFRSVKRSNCAMSWNACDISMALFQVLQVFWRNNIASMVENISWKPLKMPFLRLKRLKMSLDASALKNLCLWCKFQSHLLFIISLLLENVLTALLTCLLDSACAKPNDSCKCWSWLSGVGILEWDIENDNYRLYWAISPQSRFHSTTDRLLAIRLSLQYKVLYLTYGK